jgi:hypothetical protein
LSCSAALPVSAAAGNANPVASRAALAMVPNHFKILGLRGIEWVIFELKAREKRGLRRDSAFRGMGYLA